MDPIIGWRKWHVYPDEGVLRSIYKSLNWPMREKLCAACLKHVGVTVSGRTPACASAPNAECHCGIYAVKTNEQLPLAGGNVSTLMGLGVMGRQRVDVVGRVSLWGRILDCPLGWRAEFAYPYELVVIPPETSSSEREGEALEVAKKAARKLQSNYLVDTWVIT